MSTKAARDRIGDPDGHYPYKYDEAMELDLDAPAGNAGPGDRSKVLGDYISPEIIEATAAYVSAQEAYVLDPGDGTRAAYEGTRDELIAARQTHRQGRVGTTTTVEG